jgi:hypothetical protein
VHSLPGDQAANDADPKATRLQSLTRRQRHPVRRPPVLGIDPVSDDARPSGHRGRGFAKHGAHVFAHGDERFRACGRPTRERRAARVEVVHHVVLGAQLRATGAARGARPQYVRPEGMRVHDIDSLLGDAPGEPADVGRRERSVEIGERVLANVTAVVDPYPRSSEIRGKGSIGREESDFVVRAGLLRAGREVHEETLGSSDIAAHDDVHDAYPLHQLTTPRQDLLWEVGPR